MMWQVDKFYVDAIGHRLLDCNGDLIPIQPKAFRVLEFLIRSAPDVVSREQLLVEVWGHAELSVSCLSQAIREIRRATEDDAAYPKIVGTQHGTGYFLLLEPKPVKQLPSIVDPQTIQRKGWLSTRTGLYLAVALPVTLVLSAFLLVPDKATVISEAGHQDNIRHSDFPALATPAAATPYYSGLQHLARFDWSKAINDLERAHRAENGSIHIDFQLARAYFHAGHHEKASDLVLRSLSALQPNSQVQQAEARAATALVQGDPEALGIALANLSDHFPNNPDYLFATFEARLHSAAPSIARETLKQIRDRFPALRDDPRLHLAESRLLKREGRVKQSLKSARAAAQLTRGSDSDGIRVRSALAHLDALVTLGRIDDARAGLLDARVILEAIYDPAARIDLLMLEARMDVMQGRLGQMSTYINEACALSLRAGYKFGMGHCNIFIGKLHHWNAGPASALASYATAETLFIQAGRPREAAEALVHQASAQLEASMLSAAEVSLNEADRRFVRFSDRHGHALVKITAALIDAQKRDFKSALGKMETAMLLFQSISDADGQAYTANALGRMLDVTGNPERSAALHQRALDLYRSIGNIQEAAGVLTSMGSASTRHGRVREAEEILIQAAELFQQAGSPNGEAKALVALSQARLARAEVAAANEALARAETLSITDAEILAGLKSATGIVAIAEFDLKRSRNAFDQARAIRKESGHSQSLLASDLELAMQMLEQNDAQQAEVLARSVLERLPPLASAQSRALTIIMLARSLIEQNRPTEARSVLDTIANLTLETTDIELYFRYNMLAALMGSPDEAVPRLVELRRRSMEMGYRFTALETDVAIASARMRSSASASDAEFLAEVIDSARNAGIHCLVDRLSRMAEFSD